MPIDQNKAQEVWDRYTWVRDNGHADFVKKARKCDDFFVGLQWDPVDLAKLRIQRRPALTINKIISTVSTVLGEQIYNRTDTAFRPRNEGATQEVADALTKVFMQVADNNDLPWVRSDVFCDGLITSRGFFDVRLDFADNAQGEVRITQLNPANVMIDPDASHYDPAKWGDVMVTHWLSIDEIEMLYSKADADILAQDQAGVFPYAMDVLDEGRDRFGMPHGSHTYSGAETFKRGAKRVRVIERQYRKLDMTRVMVDLASGDFRPVPSEWTAAQLADHLAKNPDLAVQKRLMQRIRWTVIAGNVVLHDDWSPYQHFTVVPFFPYFRRGTTVGLVENLLGPQELLNKVSSQELHVVNTTANSGWKVKKNSLQNMTAGELENRGAETGLVLELDDIANAEKITPNSTPTGLDRISYKSEEHIKSISGVSDYMQGFAREDVAAKSVQANKQSGQVNLAPVMDNLMRTDTLMARTVLSLIQTYYTEERLVRITTDRVTGKTDEVVVNQITPEGQIVNDLTIGEYAVVVTSQPERDNLEDSQFDQLVAMRSELGVQIPDKFLIQSSKARNKAEIIEAIESPPAPEEQERQARAADAELLTLEAEARNKMADAELKSAKAQQAMATVQKITAEAQATGQSTEMIELQAKMALQREEMEAKLQLERDKMQMEMQIKRESAQAEAAARRMQAMAQPQNSDVPRGTSTTP